MDRLFDIIMIWMILKPHFCPIRYCTRMCEVLERMLLRKVKRHRLHSGQISLDISLNEHKSWAWYNDGCQLGTLFKWQYSSIAECKFSCKLVFQLEVSLPEEVKRLPSKPLKSIKNNKRTQMRRARLKQDQIGPWEDWCSTNSEIDQCVILCHVQWKYIKMFN